MFSRNIFGLGLLFLLQICAVASVAASNGVIPPEDWFGQPAFSPDGKLVVVVAGNKESGADPTRDKDHLRYYWYEDSSRDMFLLDGGSYKSLGITSVGLCPEWAPDSKHFFVKASQRIEIYDARCHSCKSLPDNNVEAWSPDGRKILLSGRGGPVVYDLQSDKLQKFDSDKTIYEFSAVWSPDSKSFAVVSFGQHYDLHPSNLEIWHLDGKSAAVTVPVNLPPDLPKDQLPRATGNFSWTSNSKVFVYSDFKALHFLDTKSFKETGYLNTPGGFPSRFEVSPSQKLLSLHFGKQVCIIDVKTAKPLLYFDGPNNGAFECRWSPDSSHLLIYGNDVFAICSLETGKTLGYKKVGQVDRFDWSLDQRHIYFSQWKKKPQALSIDLSANSSDRCVIDGGTIGAPGWRNGPTVASLEDCYVELDKTLTPAAKAKFKGTDYIYQYGGGSIIYDSTLVDAMSNFDDDKLREMFVSKGFPDGKNILATILLGYYHHLNGTPFDLEKQIEEYRATNSESEVVCKVGRALSVALGTYVTQDLDRQRVSIDSIKAEKKLVTLLAEHGSGPIDEMKLLKAFRTKYSEKQLGMIVYVLPQEVWDADNPVKQTRDGLEPIEKRMNDFKTVSCSGIKLAVATPELWAHYRANISTKYNSCGDLPSAVIIDKDNIITSRVKSLETRDLEHALTLK